MPDQSDVETALANFASLAIYPNGPGAASATGAVTRIYRGWPNAAALDADLAAGRTNVTVFPMPGSIHDRTRRTIEWLSTPAAPTLTVSVSGTKATFAGSAELGQLAGLRVGAKSYVHRTAPGDSPALVAAILAAAVAVDRPATAAGSTVTVPGVTNLLARTGIDGQATAELRRQSQNFRITAWCPTPADRDAVVGVIDAAFAAAPFIKVTSAIATADTGDCRLRYISTTTFDQSQDAALYRRDLVYSVEYPTIATAAQTPMLFGIADIAANSATNIATFIS